MNRRLRRGSLGPQPAEDEGEVLGRRRLEPDLLARARVLEGQGSRVEELARNGRGVSGKGILQRPRVPIDTIAHDRQARMGQVHPDLVGATTPGEGGDEGEATEALPALEVGGGFPAALSRHPEPIWIPGGRLDRSLDPLRIEPRLVMTDGQVLLLHLPASELGLEMLESLQGAAEDHHPAGETIEPVHDTWTVGSLDLGKLAEALLGEVHEGSGLQPVGGMNEQPCGLVHDHDRLVLVEHLQLDDPMALHVDRGLLTGDVEEDLHPSIDLEVGPGGLHAGHPHPAGLDPGLQPGPGDGRARPEEGHESPIQTLPGELRRHLEGMRTGEGSIHVIPDGSRRVRAEHVRERRRLLQPAPPDCYKTDPGPFPGQASTMESTPISVLLVDDELGTIELLGAMLERAGFRVQLARSLQDATRALEASPFDAVVTDVVFDGMDGGAQILAATRQLRPEAITVLMTGYPKIEGAVTAIKDGAVDYLQKPVDPVVLGATIQRAVRERRITARPEDLAFQDMVDILSGLVSQTIERVDPYTAGHGERTRKYAREIASVLGIDPRTTERLELAAIAHDYGKIYLDDLTFLTKKGPLTPAEYREVQRHPEVGATKLGNHPQLEEVCQYVAEHHERWDGTGYPLRLKGSQISPAGRVLCVVEVFDSLSTKRSYKDPWDLQKTMDFFEAQSGRAFEPEVLDVFLRLLEENGEDWLQAPQRDLEAAGVIEVSNPA